MNQLRADETIGVVFSDKEYLQEWCHMNPRGNLYLAQKHPLGDRWYINEQEHITRIKLFEVHCERDEQKLRGFIFDTVILLDRYSQELVQYHKLRGANVFEILRR